MGIGKWPVVPGFSGKRQSDSREGDFASHVAPLAHMADALMAVASLQPELQLALPGQGVGTESNRGKTGLSKVALQAPIHSHKLPVKSGSSSGVNSVRQKMSGDEKLQRHLQEEDLLFEESRSTNGRRGLIREERGRRSRFKLGKMQHGTHLPAGEKQKQTNVGRKLRGGVAEQLLCGAFAGVVSRTAVAPLDLIRTHLITGHTTAAAGKTVGAIFKTVTERDGWRGLFRGNGVNCLRVAPNKAIELCAYEMLKRTLCKDDHPLQKIASPIAGGLAGMAGTLATYPLELMRTRISVQPHLYDGLLPTFFKIVREEGPSALYRGLTPSLLGVFPYAATNYFVYDRLRTMYKRATKRASVPPGANFLCGAIAAAASSGVTFPLEVARRQLQMGHMASAVSNMNGPQVLAHIYRTEGFAAIYRGLGTTWLKLVPAAGISFVCYEAAKRTLRVDDASYARAARANQVQHAKEQEEERGELVRAAAAEKQAKGDWEESKGLPVGRAL
eukprot:jgi/Mesen1/3969/ME000210S03204